MTREEQRTQEFIAGMNRLTEGHRAYIRALSLYLTENPALIPNVQNTGNSGGREKPRQDLKISCGE